MLISRGLALFNRVSKHATKKDILINKQINKFSHVWAYRDHPGPEPGWLLFTEVIAGTIWWWILYHFYHDSAHITGHWKYPDPSKWTDEELGIPCDQDD